MARRRPSPSAAAAPVALLLAALAALAAPAPAAASNVYDFGDGLCAARINSQGVATLVGTQAQCRGKAPRGNKTIDDDFDLPPGVAAYRPDGSVLAAAALFTVTPEGDTANPLGTYYTVAWSGITNPRTSDRIAVLIGKQSKSDPDSTLHPRSYFFVSEVSETWAQGSGSVRIFLPLLRETVTVAYIRRSTSVTNFNGNIWRGFKTLAQAWVDPPASDPPHNVRLSIVPTKAGEPVKAAAIWQQRNTIQGATVKWRLETGTYGGPGSGSDPASVATYSRSQMCQQPAKKAGWISPGQIYRGDLTGLTPNTRYAYQVGSDGAGWSEEKTFLTPPTAADATATTRILMTADSGMYTPDNSRVPNGNAFDIQRIVRGSANTPGNSVYTVTQAIAQAAGLGPGQQPGSRGVVDALSAEFEGRDVHMVWNTGDISYARGEGHQWDLWGTQFSDRVASRALVAYSVGNHEADAPGAPDSPYNKTSSIDSGGECTVPTRRLLQMAQPSGATSDWYSADVGPVHFVSLNSEQLLSSKSKQRAWLEADLKAVDRSKTPWVVVGMHRPLFVDSNDGGDQKVAASMRQAIEGLLVKYQVDLVAAGHIHAAQRSCVGVMKGSCVGKNPDGTAKGPTHQLYGGGGYQSPLGAFQQVPAWEEFASWAYSFSEALVTRTTFTINTYAAKDRSLLDTVTLTKPEGWTPNPAQAEALYAVTASWSVPETIDLAGLTAALSVNFVAAALLNDDWAEQYLKPGTQFWDILNGLPGKDGNDYTIEQVWQIAFPLYELINTGVYGWLSPILTQDVKYIWNLIKPGGRMYYGP